MMALFASGARARGRRARGACERGLARCARPPCGRSRLAPRARPRARRARGHHAMQRVPRRPARHAERALPRLPQGRRRAHDAEDRLARPARRPLRHLSRGAPRPGRRPARPRPRLVESRARAFPLRGAHVEVACDDCHRRAGEGGAVGFHAQGIAFERCADCHDDVHGREFLAERDCGVCHTERAFGADALAAKGFDHARDADFSLEGAHAKVSCAGCHGETAAQPNRLRGGIPAASAPRDCAGCHEDPHAAPSAASARSVTRPRAGRPRARPRASITRATPASRSMRCTGSLDCAACHEGPPSRRRAAQCADCHTTAAALLSGDAGSARGAPDPHASAASCRDCHAENVAAPALRRLRARVPGLPPRAVRLAAGDEEAHRRRGLVKVEAALRARELARGAAKRPAAPNATRRSLPAWRASRAAVCTTPRSPRLAARDARVAHRRRGGPMSRIATVARSCCSRPRPPAPPYGSSATSKRAAAAR